MIVLRPGRQLTESATLVVCAEKLARYKMPHRVKFVESLPLSPQCKVLKRELRDRYGDQSISLFEND